MLARVTRFHLSKGFGVPGMTAGFALPVPGISPPRPPRESDYRFRVVITPEHVVRGLGLDRHVESAIISAVHATSGMGALYARMAVSETILMLNVDPAMRAVILERVQQLVGDRDPGREVTDALALRGLRKADPRGGKYHARVPDGNGGYRYFYDEEKYAKQPNAHVSGRSVLKGKCGDAITKRVGAGDCTLEEARDAAKEYDDDLVKDAIRDAVKRGNISYVDGKLRAKRAEAEQ